MAGRIPQSFIDDLVSRADIVEIINARVPLRKKGKEYMACCPFHGEKTPSFTVSEQKQFYHCFGCGAHGTALGFLMEYENMDFVEAVEALAAEYNMDVPREHSINDNQSSNNQKQTLFDILEKVCQLFQAQLKTSDKAVNYLKNRGLTGEIAKRYRIGYAPEGWQFLTDQFKEDDDIQKLIKTGLVVKKENGRMYDRFRDRIIFPILNTRGKVIGFGGRIIDEGEPKYLNSPENEVFYKGFELYGLFEAKKFSQSLDYLIVVEGYMDVVALAQHGVTNAVASLGTATTPDQIKKIFRSVQEIVFCYDGDTAGRKAAWRALDNTLPILRDGQMVKFLFLPDQEDPDTMIRKEGKDAFIKRVESAMSLSDFLFETLQQQNDLSTEDGKARLAEMAKPLISKLNEGVFKDLLLKRLASLVSLSEEQLQKRIPETNQKTVTPTNQKQETTEHHSTIRKTIALVLQFPQVIKNTSMPESFTRTEQPGFDLLLELGTLIQQSPDINSAALMERFRDKKEETILNKLMHIEIPIAGDVSQLFNDYLHSLEKQLKEDVLSQRQAELEQKSKQGKLSDDEKKEYIRIISDKS